MVKEHSESQNYCLNTDSLQGAPFIDQFWFTFVLFNLFIIYLHQAVFNCFQHFVLPPRCIKSPKIVLDLMYVKKDLTDASISQQLFTKLQDSYRDYIPIYIDGNSLACARVFP